MRKKPMHERKNLKNEHTGKGYQSLPSTQYTKEEKYVAKAFEHGRASLLANTIAISKEHG